MSKSLRVLPQYIQRADFSHDLIALYKDVNLLERIAILESEKGKEVPSEGVSSFIGKRELGKVAYGATIKTACDKVMKSVLVGELKEALIDYEPQHWRNKAFIGFLNEMPDDLKIWLYWS